MITSNTITGNGTGLVVSGTSAPLELNSIYGNSVYNAEVKGAVHVTAPNNWWGTTTPTQIDSRIRDGRDDSSLGLLNYVPVLAAPHPSAPPPMSPPATCDVTLARAFGGLTIEFLLDLPEPATWTAWLSYQTTTVPLWSLSVPVTSAPAPVVVPIPSFPPLGTIGLLTTLATPSRGIVCSGWTVIDTGPPTAAVDSEGGR